MTVCSAERRLLVLLTTHAALKPQLILEREELRIVALLSPEREPLADTLRGTEGADRISDTEYQRLGTATELGDHDGLPRMRALQNMRKHQQCVSCPSITDLVRQRIRDGLRGNATPFGDCTIDFCEGRRKDEMVDFPSLDAGC